MKIEVTTDTFNLNVYAESIEDFLAIDRILKSVWPKEKPATATLRAINALNNTTCDPDLSVKPKRKYKQKINFVWNDEHDKILKKYFDELGPSGIYQKGIFPSAALWEIRARCQDLGLLDQYGNRPETRGDHGANSA
jgi:hypothetical protein